MNYLNRVFSVALFCAPLVGLCSRAAEVAPADRMQRFAQEMWRQREIAYDIDRIDVKTGKPVRLGRIVLGKPDRYYQVLTRPTGELAVERVSDGVQAWQWGVSGNEKYAFQLPVAPLAQCNTLLYDPCKLFFNPSLTLLDPEYDHRYEESYFPPAVLCTTVRNAGLKNLGGTSFQTYEVEVRSDDNGAWPVFYDPDDWPNPADAMAQPASTIGLADSGGAFAYSTNVSHNLWLVLTPAKLAPGEAAQLFAKRPPADAKVARMATSPVRLGDQVKNFTLKDFSGHDVDLKTTVESHRATLLFTFPADCFGCHTDLIWAQRMFEQYRDQGLAVICVTGVASEIAMKQIFSKHVQQDGGAAVTTEQERVVGLYRHFKKQYSEGALAKADQPEYPVLIDRDWTGRNDGDIRANLTARYPKLNNFILDPQGRVVYWSGPRLGNGGPSRAFIATLEQLGVVSTGDSPAKVAAR